MGETQQGAIRYTYLNEDQIDVELKCSICDEPFQSPMNCKFCGNTYCRICITQWLRQQSSCPSCRQVVDNFLPVISRVVLNQLNRLVVQCQLCEKKNIQRSDFNDHLMKICPKQIVPCTDQCGWNGCRENLAQHVIECREKRSQATGIFQRWMAVIMLVLAILLIFIVNK